MNDLKNLDLSESLENKENFRLQSKEAQKFDLLLLTSELIAHSMTVIYVCEFLENKIEDNPNPQLLIDNILFEEDFNLLGYSVTTVLKKYARFNSFIDIYLANKNDEQ